MSDHLVAESMMKEVHCKKDKRGGDMHINITNTGAE